MGARRLGALVLAATLATGLAACGGDDDEGSDVNLEELEDDSSGSASGTEDEEAAEDESGDEGSSGDLDDLDGFFSEGCGEFIQIFAALGASVGGSFGGEDADEAIAAFEDAVEDAPDEFQDEFEIYAQAFAEYGEALQDAGVDFSDPSSFDPSNAEAFEAMAEAAEVFNEPEVAAASEAINEFISAGCES